MEFDLAKWKQEHRTNCKLVKKVYTKLKDFNLYRIKYQGKVIFCYGKMQYLFDSISLQQDFFHDSYYGLFSNEDGNFLCTDIKWWAATNTMDIIRTDGVVSVTGYHDENRKDNTVTLGKFDPDKDGSAYLFFFNEKLIDENLSRVEGDTTYYVMDMLRLKNAKDYSYELSMLCITLGVKKYLSHSMTFFYAVRNDKLYFGLWDLVANEPILPLEKAYDMTR